MGLFGRTTLAAAILNLVLLVSAHARAALEVAKDGQSRDSIWKVADVGLYLDESLEKLPDALDSLSAALQIWSIDPRLPHVWPMLGGTDPIGYHEGHANRNTLRFAENGETTAKGALAITMVSYKDEEKTILDGDIVINGLYCFGNLRDDGRPKVPSKRPVYDLTDVLVHELGHWFGLADAPEDPSSVMYPYFDAGETRALGLGEGDRQALDLLYSSSAAQSKGQAGCSLAVRGQGGGSYILAMLGLVACARWRRRSAQ